MRVNGKTTFRTVMELRNGLMELNTKVTTRRVRRVERVYFILLMGVDTRVSSLRMKSVDSGNTFGLMARCTQDNG